MLRTFHSPERGASLIEYAAVVLLVAALISAVLSAGIDSRVGQLIKDSLNSAASAGFPTSPGDDTPDDDDAGEPSNEEAPGNQPTGQSDGDENSGQEDESAPDPQTDTADNPQGQEPDVEPADNVGDDGTYGLSMAGLGAWGEDFANQAQEEAAETWHDTKDETNEFLDAPLGYAGDQLSETGDTLAEGWNYMNDRRDELNDQQSENFSQRWDNGEYGSALLGYTGDMFAIPLWKQPFSAGGLFRGTVDSIQELETQEVLDAREAGEDGKADAMVAWNTLGMFISPLDRLKIPDTPGGGPRGDGNDEGSNNEESTDQNNKDEDNNPNCTDNSFTPGTPVLAANGSTVPIEDIDVGDEVLAFDPVTGEEGPREVTDTITGDGQKTLVDITVTDTDGQTTTLTATTEHPFWAPKAAKWVDAINLEPGTWLRTSTGTWTQITATDTRTVANQQVHNLTIDDLHTYYVGVGDAEILVHNDSQDPCAGLRQHEIDTMHRMQGIFPEEDLNPVNAPDADYVGKSGKFDAMGHPAASRNWGRQRQGFLNQIVRHAQKSDNAVVDLTGFDSAHVDDVMEHVRSLDSANQNKIIVIQDNNVLN